MSSTNNGAEVPDDEIVTDAKGANPAALDRFTDQALPASVRDELLAQLAGIPRPNTKHRPVEMTKGDIHPDEWAQLNALYLRLKGLVDGKVKFSALASSTFLLLQALAVHGRVVTNDVLNGIMPAYGYDQATIDSFDAAVSIVWSMAQQDYPTSPELEAAIEQLTEEISSHEDHFG